MKKVLMSDQRVGDRRRREKNKVNDGKKEKGDNGKGE